MKNRPAGAGLHRNGGLSRRLMGVMRKSLLILAFLIADVAVAYYECSNENPCVWRVIDGDTIEIAAGPYKQVYRLCGIDAPELGTQVGEQAKAWLHNEILRRNPGRNNEGLMCLPVGKGTPCDGRSEETSYGRIVAQCFVGGDDIAEMLVERGLATPVQRYSGTHYETDL